jgi:DNA-binding Xre family transcriptional regulator
MPVLLSDRGMTLSELSERVGITVVTPAGRRA